MSAGRETPTLMQAWADACARRIPPPYESTEERAIDKGIAHAVRILFEFGVETTQSCEGGDGHAFLEPTVCFNGSAAEGFRAAGIALEHGLPVAELRRVWSVQRGEITGPEWQMTFTPAVRTMGIGS